MTPQRLKQKSGFTLLEILIATVIMAFISVFTARMIQQGVKARSKIREEIDRSTSLHDALGLITQDIQKAFSYHDINIEIYNAAQKQRQKTSQTPPPPPPPGGTNPTPPPTAPPPAPGATEADAEKYKLKEEKTLTRFIGDKDKLSFTSLNNYRNAHNLQQSDQCEIGYYLEHCKGRTSKESDVQCLWRRVSPYIDDIVTEGGTATPIIEDVKSLKFRYLGKGHEEEWVETWKTEQGEDVMKGRFPMAVEVTVSVNDRRSSPPKEISMTVVASPRFANDPPPPPADNNNQQGLPGQGQGQQQGQGARSGTQTGK